MGRDAAGVDMTGTRAGAGVSRRRSLAVWLLLWLVAAAALVSAVGTGRAISGEPALLPLDDAYIHLQYARQLAAGQPYVYNPGLPPTSGATSFLYPYLLAPAALFGAVDLQWGLWALVIGAVALALGGWLIYQAALALGVGFWPAALTALAYTASGAALWHAMSGMETALAMLAVLLAAYGIAARSDRWTLTGAGFAAVIRPEWAIVTALALAVLAWRWWGEGLRRSRRWAWLAAPLALVGVQPLVNLLLTGSAVASGNAAKSIFGVVPFDAGQVLARWAEQVVRIWGDLISGSLGGGPLLYVALPTLALAALGAAALLRRTDTRPLLFLIGGTLLLGTLAIATLDTAFWHFRRYQMPMFALLFLLAAAGTLWVTRRRWAGVALGGVVLAGALASVPGFARAYAVNAGSIDAQPLPMARWLAANTPADAVIAVHDVGMMRFLGGRTTLDLVGLTTPGAADYWRNGPGAVGELVDRERPDFVASYGEGHGLGLGYLEATSIYGEALARFTTVLDPDLNVALAAETQGIFRPDYAAADRSVVPQVITRRTGWLAGWEAVDTVDVADVAQERAHGYRWTPNGSLSAFPSEWFEFSTAGCAATEPCVLTDGGRLIAGEESFTFDTRPGQDVVLVTRVNASSAGQLGVYVNGARVATRIVPFIPGRWLEIPVLIPGEQVTDRLNVRIVPETPGMIYQPYFHWAYQGGAFEGSPPTGEAVATWQDGAITLAEPAVSWELTGDGRTLLQARLTWTTNGEAAGDAMIFVHVLDSAGAIAAQMDQRPGGGGLPPGNWLPGSFSDTIMLDVTGLPPGEYEVMAGLYDPVTQTRWRAQGGDEANRVSLGTVVLRDGDGSGE
jgi:hypothetical protein